jgi:hypothetical protein
LLASKPRFVPPNAFLDENGSGENGDRERSGLRKGAGSFIRLIAGGKDVNCREWRPPQLTASFIELGHPAGKKIAGRGDALLLKLGRDGA